MLNTSHSNKKRVVHLPFFADNTYQTLLMHAEEELGWETLEGGGGGQFFRSALYRWEVDVLHFHWLHPYMLKTSCVHSAVRSVQFYIELLLLRLCGKRLVWTLHNLENHDGLHLGLERWFLRRIVRLFHIVICHSNASADDGRSQLGISPSKIRVIPHGNYIDVYPSGISRTSARNQLAIAQDARVFLFLGRIAAYKGVAELVNTFCRIAEAEEVLLIAGRSVDKFQVPELLRAAAGDRRVRICEGFVDNDDLQVYFAASDVAVFPFRQITTSGSVILAMSFGIQCLASATGGIPELLEDPDQLFDVRDPSGLATAMIQSRSKKPESIGSRNFVRAQRWTWSTVAFATVSNY